METTSGSWPWIAILTGIAGFAGGYLAGRPRIFAAWGGPALCGAACTCTGITCGLVGQHTHCPKAGFAGLCRAGCKGTCDGGAGTHVVHTCTHGHPF